MNVRKKIQAIFRHAVYPQSGLLRSWQQFGCSLNACHESRSPIGQEFFRSLSEDAIEPGRYFTARSLSGVAWRIDAILANRLPDVELLSPGGAGVAMLAASYAAERELKAVALVPKFGRFPTEIAIERRDAELVAIADAAG